MKRQSFYIVLSIAIALLIISSGTLIHLLTESWWFAAVGFTSVFQTRLIWPIALGLSSFLLHLIILGLNYKVASHFTEDYGVVRIGRSRVELSSSQISPWIGSVLVLFLSLSAGTTSGVQWEKVLQYVYRTPFGETDPIFGLDLGFYFFQLPFYQVLHSTALSVLGGSLFIAVLLYAIKGAIDLNQGWRRFLSEAAKVHLAVLLAILALLIAVGFWLQRYDVLYSPSGVVFGAGYTDVHARLQAYGIMGGLTLILGVIFVLSLWRQDLMLPVTSMATYGLALVLIMGVYPNLQQQVEVEPYELNKEAPYIAHNLDFTRKAYQLDQVQRQAYDVQNTLTIGDLQDNQATLHNIRLWNYEPILSTYRQLQELRLYYRFQGVDIDRYSIQGNTIPGENTHGGYQQVMLSAREMDASRLPSQTWVNQRLKYTHGYGLVMSPVDQVNSDGLPSFLIKDLPPVSPPELPVDQPSIYYGELTGNYIFTGTSTDEFDYPLGNDNASVRYSGEGGVPMPSPWHRFIYAMDIGSLKILISRYFTPESRIHYYRQIQQRVEHIAPFLYFDQDPYLVLANGHLQWVLDAYTVSNRYPYSQPISFMKGADQVMTGRDAFLLLSQRINYIRNSVKVVVDAYDGHVTFYSMDADPYGITDPVLATYRKAFPDLFQPATDLPPELQAHLRYPQDLFKIQSLLYLSYHMANPEVFYNQEDLWSFPTEVSEVNQTIVSEPYYVIMQLPGESQPEMVLIFPFTPVNKDNMIAWMAARSDGENYGNLLLYEFPKQELVYGPSQIEARVDQTPEISQQLTLWSQQGSRVIRGNLLVIPIEESLLYVEPIYLRAEQGELPELRRVIVAYGDQVVMEPTLDQALTTIFGKLPSDAPAPAPTVADPLSPPTNLSEAASAPAIVLPETVRELVIQTVETYEQGQAALRQGDWDSYGQSQEKLEQLLQELETQTQP
ncbi:MAG: UPF0182 family protein [Prochlorotrichaceae cyanobacterium]|jgi:uncharacterized membrane protein (UPF0182 family)